MDQGRPSTTTVTAGSTLPPSSGSSTASEPSGVALSSVFLEYGVSRASARVSADRHTTFPDSVAMHSIGRSWHPVLGGWGEKGELPAGPNDEQACEGDPAQREPVGEA